jgi:hypothetical protein
MKVAISGFLYPEKGSTVGFFDLDTILELFFVPLMVL